MIWNDAVHAQANTIADLLVKKQADYGKQNITDFGLLGVLVRANDKINRLKTLTAKWTPPENESIRDSWADLAGYALLALMLIDGEFDAEVS